MKCSWRSAQTLIKHDGWRCHDNGKYFIEKQMKWWHRRRNKKKKTQSSQKWNVPRIEGFWMKTSIQWKVKNASEHCKHLDSFISISFNANEFASKMVNEMKIKWKRFLFTALTAHYINQIAEYPCLSRWLNQKKKKPFYRGNCSIWIRVSHRFNDWDGFYQRMTIFIKQSTCSTTATTTLCIFNNFLWSKSKRVWQYYCNCWCLTHNTHTHTQAHIPGLNIHEKVAFVCTFKYASAPILLFSVQSVSLSPSTFIM